MRTTLGEELLLLSLDDDTGARAAWWDVDAAVAAATLVELAMAERIEVVDDVVHVVDPAPVGVPVLDAALAGIGEARKPPKVDEWAGWHRGDAVEAAIRGLVEKGLVREERKRVLGLFPTRRYPEADGSAESELRERLDAAVLHGEKPDERTVALVALLHGVRQQKLAFPDADQRAVAARMADLADGEWSAPALRRAAEMSAAVAAALTVTTTVTTVDGG